MTKVKPQISRGFARDAKDAERLKAAGVRVIFREDRDEPVDVIRMRKGESLGVVDGFLAFGKNKRAIRKAVAMIHEQGATVVDVETGRDSRTHALLMLSDAVDPKMTPEHMQMMRDARNAERKNGRLAVRAAQALWHDARYSWQEALELMDGWTKYAAYNELGLRNVRAGRRPNGTRP